MSAALVERITLSDGTEVELEAPGMAFAIEAEGGIPDLPALVEAAGRDSGKAGELSARRRADLYAFGALLIEHGTRAPRFRRAPGEGERAIGRLLEPDFEALVGAIARLRAEKIRAAVEHYRPTPAAGGVMRFARPGSSPGFSEADLRPTSE
jgi:hypothetical protein